MGWRLDREAFRARWVLFPCLQQTLRHPSSAFKPQRIEAAAGEADAIGDESLLGRRRLALVCSRKCSGDVILKTYNFARMAARRAKPLKLDIVAWLSYI